MRIAIVNDLALAREALRRVVHSVPGYHVVWMAEDGAQAVERARQDRPDVVLMDLVMPVMNGVEATRQIMRFSPCPILLVTSSMSNHIGLVYEALGCGGLDAVTTPTLGPDGRPHGAEGLLSRLARLSRERSAGAAAAAAAASADTGSGVFRALGARPAAAADPTAGLIPPLVALGASTGGPEALARVLEVFPATFRHPVLVVQHIGVDFVADLVVWLRGRCALPVSQARDGQRPQPGAVLVAATEDHLALRSNLHLAYTPDPVDYPFRPSVDVLFESLGRNWPTPGVAVLLTGMGNDGARGLKALRQAGWLTIAQDEATSVVYGMPRAAAEMRAASRVLPVAEIGAAVIGHLAMG